MLAHTREHVKLKRNFHRLVDLKTMDKPEPSKHIQFIVCGPSSVAHDDAENNGNNNTRIGKCVQYVSAFGICYKSHTVELLLVSILFHTPYIKSQLMKVFCLM